METLKFNRPLAIAVLILVIAAAIPCGVLRSVSALERKTERIYEEGDKRDGTVRADLTKLAEYAQNLYAAAEPAGCADGTFAEAIRTLQASLATPMTEDTLTPLMNAASLSYNRIMAHPTLSEAQKKIRRAVFLRNGCHPRPSAQQRGLRRCRTEIQPRH